MNFIPFVVLIFFVLVVDRFSEKKRVVKNTEINSSFLLKENNLSEKKVVVKKKHHQIISVSQKKKLFKEKIVPIVQSVHNELFERFVKVSKELNSSEYNETEIQNLMKTYRAKNKQELLEALKPAPVSIVLAQAAIESAWGTSRFFREANNLFGVWAFSKNIPRIKAGETRDGKTIWLKKYPSVEASIRDYYRVLSRSPYLKKFRELNLKTNNPEILIQGLLNYSEKRLEYVKTVSDVVKHNKFDMYDKEVGE